MLHAPARLAAGAIAALLCASTLEAGIITTRGSARSISPQFSLNEGDVESNLRSAVFAEQSGVVLRTAILANITDPGTYDDFSKREWSSLAAGTVVDSFLLHQDSRGDKPVVLRGSVTFDAPILGILITGARLNRTDDLFGLDGGDYPEELRFRRGIDLRDGEDRIKLSADRRTITFRFESPGSVDQIRILTQSAVPAPGALALLGAAGLIGRSRRRR